MKRWSNIIFLIIILMIIGCSKNFEPINYQKDECAHCMMTITDPKFGCELITDKGKVFKFDSIECMVDYILIDRNFNLHSLWISDYSHPNTFVDAKRAFFILSEKINSPMGMNLAGVKTKEDADKLLNEFGGRKLNWDEVIQYIKYSKQ